MSEEKTRNRVREVVGIAGAAVGGIAEFSTDPRMRVGAAIAKSILGLVGKLLERRKAEDVIEALRALVEDGAAPITDEELREQEAAIVAQYGESDPA